jgi:hypothetical protein
MTKKDRLQSVSCSLAELREIKTEVIMNRSKYQKRIELAQRLQAVDVPLEINVVAGESGLVMRQFGEELESYAFNTKYRGAGYARV